MQAPAGWNTNKIGDITRLLVNVIGKESISFSSDFGARIFLLEDQKWIEVENLMEYPPGTFLLSPSEGNLRKQVATSLAANLPDIDHEVKIRIFLIGNVYRDGQITDESTAAYIDLELNP